MFTAIHNSKAMEAMGMSTSRRMDKADTYI